MCEYRDVVDCLVAVVQAVENNFHISAKDIKAEEFNVYAQLGFSLHLPDEKYARSCFK
jgi:hypothetical protein